MTAPTSAITTSRPDLAEGLVEFDLMGNMAGMVAAQIYRPFVAGGVQGTFGRIPVEQLIAAAVKTQKSIGGDYGRDEFDFDPVTWTCKRYGRESLIDDQERNNYGNYFDLEMVKAQRAQNQVLEAAESRVVSVVTDETTYAAQTANASVAWGTVATSKPLTDVKVAKINFRNRTGCIPNALAIDWATLQNLLITESLLDVSRSQGFVDVRAQNLGGTMQAAKATLAALFDLPNIIIAGAVQNTAARGATASISSIFPAGTALVTRVAESNDIQEPCIGRTFYYAGDGTSDDGMGHMRPVVETYRDETRESDVVRVKFDVDEKLLYSEMIELIAID